MILEKVNSNNIGMLVIFAFFVGMATSFFLINIIYLGLILASLGILIVSIYVIIYVLLASIKYNKSKEINKN
ncbi:MAG: hypothetical protein QXU98_05545 [Candidatus Parvarchaeota archaeon]